MKYIWGNYDMLSYEMMTGRKEGYSVTLFKYEVIPGRI